MSNLHHFRTKRSSIARNILAMFTTMFLLLSLQPCAMAFTPDSENSTDMSTMMSDTGHPCDHCPEPATDVDCQFDEFGTPNQHVSLTQDAKPNPSLDKVIVLISLTHYKPQSLSPPVIEPSLNYRSINTPTLKRDIILC